MMKWVFIYFLMIRRPPRSTRTDTLFPYTALVRSKGGRLVGTRLGDHCETLVAPDGSKIQTGAASSGDLEAAVRASGAPFAVAASSMAPTTPVARAAMSAVLFILSFRSEEHTSELQSLMRISYAVFCLKQKNTHQHQILLSLPPILITIQQRIQQQ